MRFALFIPNYGPYGDPRTLCELAARAEDSGWDGVFLWDQLIAEPPVADSWVALAAIAERTESLALGPMIVPLPRRRPWRVALEAATLTRLAPGRVIVGVGLGVPLDFSRFGEPDDTAARANKLEEGLALLRRLLSGERVNHAGTHYRVEDVGFSPIRVPIWASGFWPRRAPIHGARHADGFFPNVRGRSSGFRTPTVDEVAAQRRRFIADGGPEDGDLAVWCLDPGAAHDFDAYAEAGVTWWLETGAIPLEELRARAGAGPPRGDIQP